MKNNLFKKIFIALSLAVICLVFSLANAKAQETAKIYFFYGTGCPHCALVEQYFEQNSIFNKYPIEKKEIYSNHDNAVLFNSLMDKLQIPSDSRGVPAVVLGDKVLIGDKPIIENFVNEAGNLLKQATPNNTSPTPAVKGISDSNKKTDLTILAVIGGALVVTPPSRWFVPCTLLILSLPS